jgi:hypothetical protein
MPLHLHWDIYNLSDAKEAHKQTGLLVELFRKYEGHEVAETPKAKRGKKEPLMEQSEKQIDLPFEMPAEPAPDPIDLATLDRDQLDAELKKRAPAKGGVVWLREILDKHNLARASELSDEQLREVLR